MSSFGMKCNASRRHQTPSPTRASTARTPRSTTDQATLKPNTVQEHRDVSSGIFRNFGMFKDEDKQQPGLVELLKRDRKKVAEKKGSQQQGPLQEATMKYVGERVSYKDWMGRSSI